MRPIIRIVWEGFEKSDLHIYIYVYTKNKFALVKRSFNRQKTYASRIKKTMDNKGLLYS